MRNTAAASIPYLALTCLLLLAACGGPAVPQVKPLSANAVVLAFGDSLTFGKGAKAAESYPAVLQQLIGRRVVRSGVSGEVSARGLRRLGQALDRHRPDLLVLCHGGNDILRRMDRQKAEANLRAMVKLARARGIDVVLVGVPEPGFFLSGSAEFYRRIAKDLALPYEDEAVAAILSDRALRSDRIHPNAKGYRRLAEAVAGLLRKAGAV